MGFVGTFEPSLFKNVKLMQNTIFWNVFTIDYNPLGVPQANTRRRSWVFSLQLAYRVSSYVTRILYWLEFSEDHLVWLKKNTRRTLFMLSLFGVENFYMQCCCFLRWLWDIFEMALRPRICVKYFLSFPQKKPVTRENWDKLSVYFSIFEW